MKVKFVRDYLNVTWYREYSIILEDNDKEIYLGWVCKYQEKDKEWHAYSDNLGIEYTQYNNEFDSLTEAKEYIKRKVNIYYGN